MEIFIILNSMMQGLWDILYNLPWKEIALFVGALLGGGGAVKAYEIYTKDAVNKANIKAEFREELRKEIEVLRKRIDTLEQENREWRDKFFSQQEQYYEIKRENEDLRHALEHLENKVKKLKQNG